MINSDPPTPYRRKHHLRALFRSVSFVLLVAGFCVYNQAGRYGRSSLRTQPIPGQVNDGSMPSEATSLLTQSIRRLDDEAADYDEANSNSDSCEDKIIADPKWQLVFYSLGVLYMFLALAIVCDEFFIPSLEEMCSVRHMNLSMDVAGATLMAAGGSAPELFTALFGTFKESAVGFGTIVGSAVFNVLFVIGMCSLLSKEVLQLSWWPLFRDSIYYIIGLGTLAVFIGVTSVGKVELWEACVLFGMYVGYVVLMVYNERLYTLITGKKLGNNTDAADDDFVLVEGEQIGNTEALVRGESHYSFRWHGTFRAGILKLISDRKSWSATAGIGMVSKIQGDVSDVFQHVDKDRDRMVNKEELRAVFEELRCYLSDEELDQTFKELDKNGNGLIDEDEFTKWYVSSEQRMIAEAKQTFNTLDTNNSGTLGRSEVDTLIHKIDPNATENDVTDALKDMYQSGDLDEVTYKEFSDWYLRSIVYQHKKQEAEDESEGIHARLRCPKGKNAGYWAHTKYIILLPLMFSLAITIPDVRRPGRGKYCYFSFVLAIAWIGLYSYFMVEWAEIIGATVGIPDIIMGLTFLAAGTSVPDLLSSVIVARMGHGDMAVSSSIGSNIFDILVGLPLPWIIYTLYPGKPSTVSVGAEGVGISIAILLVMILLIILTIHCNGWKLTKAAGVMMFVLYFAFVAQAVFRELPFETCVFM